MPPPKKKIRAIPDEMPEFQTASAKIRWLLARDWEKGDIARTLGIEYQQVYKVVTEPVKQPREAVE